MICSYKATVEKVTIAGAGPTVHVLPMSAPVAVVSQTGLATYYICMKGQYYHVL